MTERRPLRLLTATVAAIATGSLGWAAAALAVGVASLGRLNRLANARALAGSFAGKQE